MTKMATSSHQLVGSNGTWKMNSPAATIAAARMVVVVIPPSAIPARIDIIGAGDMTYRPRFPESRSQYRGAPIDQRTLSQNVVIAPPRMTMPPNPAGAPIARYEYAKAATDRTGSSVSWKSHVRLRTIHTARG